MQYTLHITLYHLHPTLYTLHSALYTVWPAVFTPQVSNKLSLSGLVIPVKSHSGNPKYCLCKYWQWLDKWPIIPQYRIHWAQMFCWLVDDQIITDVNGQGGPLRKVNICQRAEETDPPGLHSASTSLCGCVFHPSILLHFILHSSIFTQHFLVTFTNKFSHICTKPFFHYPEYFC